MSATAAHAPRRRLFAPEVIQTSAMDCGPASLKCLLDGLGVPVSYGRLREACQTAVDGTSIDTMEEIAKQLGLEAEQIMVPVDHLLVPAANTLPAIVVVQLGSGMTHFVVVWRLHGGLVQVMDPGKGRRWMSRAQFARELYVHTNPVPADAWRDWAGSETFLETLRTHLARLGVRGSAADALVATAEADPSWRGLGALDAATRAVGALVAGGGVARGAEALRVLTALAERAAAEGGPSDDGAVPGSYWSVRPSPAPSPDGETQLLIRGAVLVRALGRTSALARAASADDGITSPTPALPPELAAALAEPPSRPGRELLRMLRGDGTFTWSALLGALVAVAAGTTLEAVLFRGLFDLGGKLALPEQRIGAVAALALFITALLLLELPVSLVFRHLGRRLETALRVAFLTKLPRLGVRYFQSRPTSDMAERSHTVHGLRTLPGTGGALLRTMLQLTATTLGVAWLHPPSAPIAAAMAAVSIAVPLAMQPVLAERDLRQRIHGGALTRFYLDALLGLVAVRAHGAERAVRREHEGLLVEWVRAGRARQVSAVLADGVRASISLGLAAWLVFDYLSRSPSAGWALLLLYWALNLPTLGEDIANQLQQYPAYRNVTLRLLEPLGAIEDGAPEAAARIAAERATEARATDAPGVTIALEGVTVQAGGHSILEGVDLTIAAGTHVGVVGPSGAGKSSLVGLLLGWHRAAEGKILVDGEPLEGARLDTLRQETAWVDPAVQLWNRSFLDNVCYGAPDDGAAALGAALEDADLHGVLRRMPDGMQTTLGEGGALVSGGEGQRVRYGRALLRTDARLVILDEPFRGLDRERRHELLARARAKWARATFLCVTHDVGETRGFARVLVIEGGRIVEDGAPADLAARPGSRYAAMLAAEDAVRRGMWTSAAWRRLWLARGKVTARDGVDEAR